MSERLGRVRLLASEADEYLGTTAGLAAMSERTHEEFDAEVRRLLDDAEDRAREIVEAHREVLDKLVVRLSERETLEGEALAEVLAGAEAAA
jgi:cell division protease FtsH